MNNDGGGGLGMDVGNGYATREEKEAHGGNYHHGKVCVVRSIEGQAGQGSRG